MAEFAAPPLWTDAYLGDTTHLTTIEHGAYLLLLMTAWRTRDCVLPDDDRLLARYARLDMRQWKRIRPILADFFTVENGQWRQGRLDDERAAVMTYRQKQSEKGKSGARAKSLKRHERPKAAANSGCDSAEAQVQPDASSLLHTHIPLDKSNGADTADPDKVFWANAKAFLAPEARGDPGKLVGAWCRDYGKEATAQAITRAQLERPVQRIPFIIGCLKHHQAEAAGGWDGMA
jgi:uncharacterized protein YdaU (DUF1376 family)